MFQQAVRSWAPLFFPVKNFTAFVNAVQAHSSTGFMKLQKFASFINFRIWDPSKTSAFNFSIDRPGNFMQMYLKQSPCLARAFTNCFFMQSFCEEEEIQFWNAPPKEEVEH